MQSKENVIQQKLAIYIMAFSLKSLAGLFLCGVCFASGTATVVIEHRVGLEKVLKLRNEKDGGREKAGWN